MSSRSPAGRQNLKLTPPIILHEGKYVPQDIERLKTEQRIWVVRDVYRDQLSELFEIHNPSLRGTQEFSVEQEKFTTKTVIDKGEGAGNWIYYPWSGMLVHAVNEEEYFELRTNRNRNLITRVEQEKMRNFSIGIAGLSVGSNVALAAAYMGMGKTMKLAEYDTLETTNLNRIRARIDEIGMSKMDLTRQRLYEVDPYVQISVFSQGLTKENILEFVQGDPKPNIIFEIIDSFELKVHLRLAAREARIPVITPANLGDRILLDIERYDLEPDRPLFHGRIDHVVKDMMENPDVTDEQKNRYAIELVEMQNIPERAIASVKEIGKTLVGRPQLATTVTISGGLCAYIAQRIALGENVPSGRRLIKFEDWIV